MGLRVFFAVLWLSIDSVFDATAYNLDTGLAVRELEFLSDELNSYECQQLVQMLGFDEKHFPSTGNENCLDQLIKCHRELAVEGGDIAVSIFRHKLAQLGKQELADWLTKVDAPPKNRDHVVQEKSSNDDCDLLASDSEGGEYSWTYMDFAICTLSAWAFLALSWLFIQLIVINLNISTLCS